MPACSARATERNEIDQLPTCRLARLAERQRGVVSRAQLRDAGFSSGSIDLRVHRGELHRLHRGVYLVGHRASIPGSRDYAAVLACGHGAVVSHVSAGALWSPTKVAAVADVDVVMEGNRRLRARAGITTHRTATLDPADVRDLDGLPVTAPARTLIDLASVAHPFLDALYSDLLSRRLLGQGDLEAALDRAGRRRGAPLIRALIDANERGFTRSEAERRMRRLCRAARLPAPRTNARIVGYEVDFLWSQDGLIVEVDGFQFHGHRAAFERDRRKDQALIAAGYRVMRVTWRQLTDEPYAVVAVIAAGLRRQSGSSRDPH